VQRERSPTATVAGPALRFALNAPPYGLRRVRSGLGQRATKMQEGKRKKGDTSIELRKGTFQKSLDRQVINRLTPRWMLTYLASPEGSRKKP
jgi:hypothetical protein